MMTAQLEAAIADRFDLLKDSFPDDLNGYQLLETAIRNHIESLKGSLLLDLGSGKGRFHSLWESAGLNSIGMDRSSGMLRGAVSRMSGNKRNGKQGSLLPLVQATAGYLPFKTESFDVLCSVEAISHFPDIDNAIVEMHRVLRPGGRIILVDKNYCSLDVQRPYLPAAFIKWIDQRRGYWMYPREFSYQERWFWWPTIRRKLDRGFENIKCEYVLSPEESECRGQWIFQRFPVARRMMLISATRKQA